MSHCTSNITMTVLSTVYFSSFPEDIIMVYPNPFSCQVVRHHHVPLAFLHNAHYHLFLMKPPLMHNWLFGIHVRLVKSSL